MVDGIINGWGNALYQATVDKFIAGEPVAGAVLRPVWRNSTQSPLETWEARVYEQFYRTVRAVNWALPARRQIRVLAATHLSTGPRSPNPASSIRSRRATPSSPRWCKNNPGQGPPRATGSADRRLMT